jgi:hypothetical protein
MKKVMMMAVLQLDFQAPSAIGLATHRVEFAVPIVEIAQQSDLLGLRRPADKYYRFDDFFRFEPFELSGK